jgi:hypothetical protein
MTLQAERAERLTVWLLVAGSNLSSGHLTHKGARAVFAGSRHEVSRSLGNWPVRVCTLLACRQQSMHLASQAAGKACGDVLACWKT